MSAIDLNTILNNIKAKIFLSEIIGRDVHLIKKGREFVGNCPFHLEKTGSFFVNDEKGKYYCFGCGAHGDMVSYVMDSKGYSFKQAIEFLARETGIKLPEDKILVVKDNNTQKIMEKCVNFFQEQLRSNEGVIKYCNNRGLNLETLEKFKIGYCPKDTSDFFQKLLKSGFQYTDIRKTGIFKDQTRSKFSARLIFPVFNINNQTIAFGARSMIEEEQPKYINSSESPVFQKKETLYGYNIASKNVSKKGRPYIVVEGYMDTVIMHQFGFNTTVASMGTAFSSEHLLRLWKYCNEPIICFDGDQAGIKAMVRAANVALEYISPGKTLKFCQLPDNHDPDSFLNANPADSMDKLLNNSLYLIDFLWEYHISEFDYIENKTPEHIASWKKNIIDNLSIIKNPELLKMYTQEIKDRIYVFIKRERSKKFVKSDRKTLISQNEFPVNKKNNALLREAILLYTVVRYRDVLLEVSDRLSYITFSDQQMNELRDCLLCETEIDDKFTKTLENLSKLAGRYCDFGDSESVEEMVCFWNDIFNNHVFKDAYNNDLKTAKKDLKDDLNESAWERLKALKIASFNKKK